MFSQEEFKDFLDSYKKRLVETDDMLEESKVNYRAKKVSVFYGLRDYETFNMFLKDSLGKTYLGIAKYVLKSIKNHPVYGTQEVQEVADSLLNVFFENTPVKEVFDSDMLQGYYKFLCDYTGRKKLEQLEKEFGPVELNLDNFEFAS